MELGLASSSTGRRLDKTVYERRAAIDPLSALHHRDLPT